MRILDGQAVSATLRASLKKETEDWMVSGNKKPHLAVVMVGNNPASAAYVGAKIKACKEIGFESSLLKFDDTISEDTLLQQIQTLNGNNDIDGILVQLPLPGHIPENTVINQIAPEKDVEGFHPISQGKMFLGQDVFLPATPYGILLMLEHYQIDTSGMNCVVIGRSHIVGTPMSILLSRNATPGNATVTICHSKTKDLKSITLQADLIVAAIGRPKFVTSDMVKEGAIIIDVGINRIEDPSRKSGYRLVGDVDYSECFPKVSYISPVPKGVGPMTICGLMKNTFKATKKRASAK